MSGKPNWRYTLDYALLTDRFSDHDGTIRIPSLINPVQFTEIAREIELAAQSFNPYRVTG